MIVKGYIETNKGYVYISDVTKDHKLVNLLTPTLITDIKVTLDSKIRTIHGIKTVGDLAGKTFYLQQLSGRVLPDEIVVVHLKKPVACYDIQSEKTDTFYCEGYPFITGDSEC